MAVREEVADSLIRVKLFQTELKEIILCFGSNLIFDVKSEVCE